MKRHPDQYLKGDERRDADGHGEGIANETRSVPESYFYLEWLSADGTVVIHFHEPLQVVGIVVDEEAAPATARAPIAKDAQDEVGFAGGMIVRGFIGTHSLEI